MSQVCALRGNAHNRKRPCSRLHSCENHLQFCRGADRTFLERQIPAAPCASRKSQEQLHGPGASTLSMPAISCAHGESSAGTVETPSPVRIASTSERPPGRGYDIVWVLPATVQNAPQISARRFTAIEGLPRPSAVRMAAVPTPYPPGGGGYSMACLHLVASQGQPASTRPLLRCPRRSLCVSRSCGLRAP
jgi:hypothetical protein